MSFWDNPDFVHVSNYVTLKDVGDTVTGIVTGLRTQQFTDNGVPRNKPVIDLATKDGPRTLTGGAIRLGLELVAHHPDIGDELTVTLIRIEPRAGGKALNHYDVVVSRGGTIVEQPTTPAPEQAPDLGLI